LALFPSEPTARLYDRAGEVLRWQSFRTKQDRTLELTSVYQECPPPGRRKLAVNVVDIFGNDTMTIVEVSVGGKK
jgi:hypothetical protein